MNNKLSVVIISQDCEAIIADAVQSAVFADEVLVLDGGSNDNTRTVAEKAGARVESKPFRGFGEQKQAAVNMARNDWIFILDSDERISDNLKTELEATLKNPAANGYLVPRLNYFFGKPFKRCGMYPDKTIRLFNRNHGQFDMRKVHEKVIVNGGVTSLKGDIIHLAYQSIDEFIRKQNVYSSMGANPSRFRAVFSTFWTFIRMYVFQGGFLEGWNGFLVAGLYSQYTFWKYIKPAPEKSSD